MKDLALLAHDLRGPIARAKTCAKLLEEATNEERAEYIRLLLEALEAMDKLVSGLDGGSPRQ